MRSPMGLLRHHHYTFYTALVLLLLATSASARTAVFSTTHKLGKLANPSNSMSSNSELSMSDDVVVHEREEGRRNGGVEMMELVMGRRRLGRLGSAPPSCRSKCGRCSPCKPVHVPIQPGRSMTLEYYPEAWRCKCGNKLFMP